ncbi:MAG: tetratricopeptide repeat protein [Deltaproteobacteria bacterium]|nr:MAG: tetratricopeptide repeat protein [Deltaproteobacteria bacterium]
MRTLVLLSLIGLTACGPKGGGVESAAGGNSTTEQPSDDGGSATNANPETPAAPTSGTVAKLDGTQYERINEAVRLLDPSKASHDPNGAKTILSQVITNDPSIAVAHLNMGVAKHQLGDLAGARSSYMSAGDLDRSLSQVQLYMGRLQEQAGRPDLALAQYKAAVEKSPDDILLREALVGGLVQAGEIDEAIRAAKAALQVNTQSVSLYNSLGLAYIEKGDYALARFVYEKARNTVAGADDSALIHANLGRVLRMQDDLPNARFHLTKAVELDDKYLPGLVHLSDLYMEDRNYGDAVKLLEKAKELDARNFWVVLNLGIAYRGTGQFDKAQAEYEAAMKLEPENPAPYFNLGILEGDHRKEYAKGMKALQTYIDMGGDQSGRAAEYIDALDKEKKRADRRREREEARKKAEQEAAERQKLLDEEGGGEPAPEGGGDPAPEEGGGEPAPEGGDQ